MPYDPKLADRLENILKGRSGFEQKEMFRGIGWTLNGNMCVGIYKEWLITRVGKSVGARISKEKHAKPMDITGKCPEHLSSTLRRCMLCELLGPFD